MIGTKRDRERKSNIEEEKNANMLQMRRSLKCVSSLLPLKIYGNDCTHIKHVHHIDKSIGKKINNNIIINSKCARWLDRRFYERVLECIEKYRLIYWRARASTLKSDIFDGNDSLYIINVYVIGKLFPIHSIYCHIYLYISFVWLFICAHCAH